MDIATHHNRQRRIVRPPGGMPQFYSHRLTEELIEVPLTKDDYLASHAIQRSISTRIIAIARQLLETAEPLDDTEDTDIDCIVAEPLVSESLFDYLIDSDRPKAAAEVVPGLDLIYGARGRWKTGDGVGWVRTKGG